ncbi:hypothetical protein AMAG_15328 [Allomyces macrogynus ATCC 38327]|uniref:ATPase of the ABC class N-terminal domain-containing protein n=1 Tax=Allomyces macrogynus (strain ATCC 38327) TaxID=578462 RepID=A0A0L0T8N3_ALLM3|nr:hypothetical protein AMAG_15328 [Allomyces macrogynus ATCC 38327]|eukprot:KNE71075.1 hypothetical protein AMAG_15328 [Allomyces macrogynus ATCC 38327]
MATALPLHATSCIGQVCKHQARIICQLFPASLPVCTPAPRQPTVITMTPATTRSFSTTSTAANINPIIDMSGTSGHGYRGGAGFRGGSGRGRGEYFKNKYGSKRGRSMEGSGLSGFAGPQQAQTGGAAQGGHKSGVAPTSSHEDLRALLQSLDRAQYGAYKRLTGNTYRFPAFDLTFQYVQSDAYAPPSALRVLVPHT